MKKEKKKILNYRNNNTSNNFKKFPKKVTNTDTKKYESFNGVSKTGDSIYTHTITSGSSRIKVKPEGQFYIRIDIFELCDQIKSIQKDVALLRKDLVKSGVLKEI